jgi:hypothetical protein
MPTGDSCQASSRHTPPLKAGDSGLVRARASPLVRIAHPATLRRDVYLHRT